MEAADRESGTPSTDSRSPFPARLARTLGALGAFAEGRRHGEEALRLAMRGRPREHTDRCPRLPRRPVPRPRGPGARHPGVRPSLALSRASGNRSWLRRIAAGLGYAYALQGASRRGARCWRRGSAKVSARARGKAALWVAWLSEVCRLAGHGEEAWQHARQALDLARQLKERGSEALALHQLGTVHAHAAPPDAEQAEAHYQQALALAEELGMRPLQAHCHLGLGRLYGQIGRREEARADLSAAIDLYRAMDMTFWLPQAEAALAQIGEG